MDGPLQSYDSAALSSGAAFSFLVVLQSVDTRSHECGLVERQPGPLPSVSRLDSVPFQRLAMAVGHVASRRLPKRDATNRHGQQPTGVHSAEAAFATLALPLSVRGVVASPFGVSLLRPCFQAAPRSVGTSYRFGAG